MKKVMLIGYGAMAQAVIERLPPQVTLGWIVARESHHAAIRQQFSHTVTPLTDPQQCEETPDLVLECASQQAVAQYGEAVLARGWHLAVISTGALADSELEQRLRQAGGKLTLLAGAVAGIDGLAAAKEGGLERVTYQSRKSPASWRGSYAEQLIDLSAVNKAQIFFEGSAREAARLFPANANVAATIALGGIGLDATRVQLMVDPATQRNTHTLHAEGLFGEFHLELSGLPLASNPKTSTLAALSAVRACRELA
ncbi:aspartate dehydrogenase [Klebsiella aerogenes]|uniref:aspartate dehydrogenase n=1 Tax=Klebsiella aerogenes TaxID=548 RepID=UPI00075E927C|nr:aspartate dehydrogenase [Klebsiella aerogenes]EIV6185267.1 aspartate dehydrogenase [Klebsiella aerogenes]EKW3881254.1 aspartate dehydrogenase [Klebsiella aerogenes]ELD8624977.1 aspartate dehydrogenase [Klebsiella aerogenes]KVJ86166.1 aspartate dehydrogenase [Klebsiella aerogenes]MDG4541657.1 aspartate dehydrogenase [Klebsiella aerogenes]